MNKSLIQIQINRLYFSKDVSMNNTVLLKEVDGDRYISIVIGTFEANFIKLYISKNDISRPLIYQLFMNYLEVTDSEVEHAIINRLEEGIFKANIYFVNNGETIMLDSRASDAIIMCLLSKSSLYVTEEVMLEAGFNLNEEKSDEDSDGDNDFDFINALNNVDSVDNMSISDLEFLLEQTIEDENYELAAKIRDIIEKKKRN